MSYSVPPETGESIKLLLAHVDNLNEKLRQNDVVNGQGENWLNQNIPDWQTSVDNRVIVKDTLFGYPKVYPKFRKTPQLFDRR